jgi:hypothetical protein
MEKNKYKLDIFMKLVEEDKKTIPLNWLKNMIYNIKIKYLNTFWYYCLNKINDKSLRINNALLQIMDLTKYRMNIHHIKFEDPNLNQKSKYCVVNFTNKILNDIPINAIFKHHQDKFPIKGLKLSTAFKYNLPICRRIYNYNNVSKNLYSSTINSCNCNKNSENFNNDHGHIITGNTNIVKDNDLKELLNLGTGFRISTTQNKSTILNTFTKNIDSMIYNNAISYSLPVNAFNEWKHYIITEFKDLINNNPTIKQHLNFNRQKAIDAILYIQNSFVVSYVDKTTSNYAFTCKYYYCKTLNETYNDSSLYKKINDNSLIIQKRINALYKKVKFQLKQFKFPYLILIPKLHKNPVKFRSVTVGCGTYLEHANKQLLKVISNIYNHMGKIGGYIIKNSYEVIKVINTLPKISHFKSYDFADLFNSINLEDLYNIMINAFEKYDLQQYTSYPKYKTYLQIVLKETYITNGLEVFIQLTGIPMGGACSSALSDIFLFTYECGTQLNNELSFFRYVDDILIVFHNENADINFNFYPQYLKLIETPHNSDNSINFLDVNLKSINNHVTYRIYNKHDDYKFNINHITNWHSSIHKNIFRNLLINHYLRCTKLNNNNKLMNNSISLYLKHAIDNGFPRNFILNNTTKFFAINRIEATSRFSI